MDLFLITSTVYDVACTELDFSRLSFVPEVRSSVHLCWNWLFAFHLKSPFQFSCQEFSLLIYMLSGFSGHVAVYIMSRSHVIHKLPPYRVCKSCIFI